MVVPRRSRKGAWIEIGLLSVGGLRCGRSRKGAWIEMCRTRTRSSWTAVAPARERGLKYSSARRTIQALRRSRKGAWIEIHSLVTSYNF